MAEGFGEGGVDELAAEVFVVVSGEGLGFGEEELVEGFGEFVGFDVEVVLLLEGGAGFCCEVSEVVVDEGFVL